MVSTERVAGGERAEPAGGAGRALPLAVLGLAGILLEAGLARVLSFKLDAFAVPVLLGVCLLGMGVGAQAVARLGGTLRPRAFCAVALCGSLAVAAGYVFLARLDVESTQTLRVAGGLLPFGLAWTALGALAAALLGAASCGPAGGARRVLTLQASLLSGVAAGALLVNPLLLLLGAPRCVLLASVLLGLLGAGVGQAARLPAGAAGLLALLVAVIAVRPEPLLEPLADPALKHVERGRAPLFWRWGPLVRVDVTKPEGGDRVTHLVLLDGRWSTTLRPPGEGEATGPRVTAAGDLPYRVSPATPGSVAVLGSGGGSEVLDALAAGAQRVAAVEESPVVHALVADVFADVTGDLARRAGVTLRRESVRGFLSGGGDPYDVVVLTAPRAFAAQSLPHASAHLLQESGLLTVEALGQMLRRLADRGVLAAHFGEPAWEDAPLRTARFAATVAEALRRLGSPDPARHVIVLTTPGFGRLATVLVRRSPFADAEVEDFLARAAAVPGLAVHFAAGWAFSRGLVVDLLIHPERPSFRGAWRPTPVSDDSPYFWYWRDPAAAGAGPAHQRERLLAAVAPGGLLLALALSLLAPRAAYGHARVGPGPALLLLGLGFAGCEVALVQKLAPALGDPLRVAGLAVPAFFGWAALGCALARTLPLRPARSAAAGLVAAGAAGAVLAAPALAAAGLAAAGPGALLVAAGVTLPAGFGLGVLGGTALASLASSSASPERVIAWAWGTLAAAFAAGTLLAPRVAQSAGLAALLGAGVAILAVGVWLQSRWRLPPAST